MAVKVIIKRKVADAKAREMIPLFRKMRSLAMNQEGYISGETLRNLNDPEDFIVISNWQSSDDWGKWLSSGERQEVQKKIDALVTLPINKEAIRTTIPDFSGHTGFIAGICKTTNYTMMLASDQLIVTHVSTHVSLGDAIKNVKKGLIH